MNDRSQVSPPPAALVPGTAKLRCANASASKTSTNARETKEPKRNDEYDQENHRPSTVRHHRHQRGLRRGAVQLNETFLEVGGGTAVAVKFLPVAFAPLMVTDCVEGVNV